MLTSVPGAGYVILSAPSKGDGVETIVHGVNTPQGNTTIISCASCTTNCITPVMEILGRRIGVKKAIMTTVHAYTASQAIVDAAHSRPRRGRAAGANLVPTSTGAAAATGKGAASNIAASSMASPSARRLLSDRWPTSSPSPPGRRPSTR